VNAEISLVYSSENIITGNAMNGSEVLLDKWSTHNLIVDNRIVNSPSEGIYTQGLSSDNVIAGNTIINSSSIWGGIFIDSSGNTITDNNIISNYVSISLQSSGNKIYHNNFINNTSPVWCISVGNVWDNDYPSGGNYWSDYTGVDLHSGPFQNETGSDGIGDASYTAWNIEDYCPLVAPITDFDAGFWNGETFNVDVVSNSTVLDFYFNPEEGAFLKFNVTGGNETFGFCRVAIPKDLLWVDDGWTVLYGSYSLNYKTFPDENYTYLYFTYTNPSQNGFTTVTINGTNAIPEFSSFIILPLFMIATLLAVIIYKRKHQTL
jgi:parallel beta-helix repeat protein